MAGAHEIHIESERLFQELRTWRSTVASHSNLYSMDALTKDFLDFKMDIVLGWIVELRSWEELGNETKCKDAVKQADSILQQIQVIFDGMLTGQHQKTWPDVKAERNLTRHLPVP